MPLITGLHARQPAIRDGSAYPPIAGVMLRRGKLRDGPGSDSCTAANGGLFDDLVGDGEHLIRYRESKHAGGLKIDN